LALVIHIEIINLLILKQGHANRCSLVKETNKKKF